MFLCVSLPLDFSTTLPTSKMLALKLTGEAVNVWHAVEQLLVISFSVKYDMLHKMIFLIGTPQPMPQLYPLPWLT